ncbi:metalloregulator ArsR/SmtB family transcription factor [Paenibacillus hemerocallicola]|uniref:Metalloregulator ArsR/SmtB family transcription factor n=1 Tax=Paenibacillus hemerocallicola TaxID=1172614 RepID=A0A5C4SX27_9BACL|nr:metalloregulator ArsR/SmtB family transcription factor [Paenibacillus hemerocallicola]TNJ53259.1 metalloregulator ArsR/SmtB family transcription factor [Paenibacillus hemerocallicola]
MQLDKIVNYHKALSDPTRVRMLVLLAGGELNGLELAERLCISPATVTHHAAKLREASLINERRDKNTIFFSLNRYFIRAYSTVIVDLIEKNGKGEEVDGMEDTHARLRQSVLKNFFTADGRLKHIPAQLKKKLIVLEHLVSRLEPGRRYTEKEINEFIGRVHDDFATIRREFIMHQYMYRDNQIYELNPKELWAKWETLS